MDLTKIINEDKEALDSILRDEETYFRVDDQLRFAHHMLDRIGNHFGCLAISTFAAALENEAKARGLIE